MRYQPNLDGLRGIAVILVLLYHFPFVSGMDYLNLFLLTAKKADAGYIGVEIFFVLSGYLITSILLDNIKKNRNHVLWQFYTKRVLRILPVFYVTIIASAIFIPGYNYFYPSVYLANYYFSFDGGAHPLRHFWSLAVEEQYYFFWPLLLVYCHRSKARIQVLVISVIATSVIIILVRDLVVETELARDLIYRSLETRMLALGIGGAMAIYGVPRIKLSLQLVLLLTVLGIINLLRHLANLGFDVPITAAKALMYDASAALFFTISATRCSLIDRLLTMRPLKITGQVSYGLYAYHLPVFFFFGATYMQMEEPIISPALASLLVGVTAVITLTSWYLMEKPLLDKKAVIIGMIDAHVRSVDKSGVGLSQHDIAGKARDRHKRKG